MLLTMLFICNMIRLYFTCKISWNMYMYLHLLLNQKWNWNHFNLTFDFIYIYGMYHYNKYLQTCKVNKSSAAEHTFKLFVKNKSILEIDTSFLWSFVWRHCTSSKTLANACVIMLWSHFQPPPKPIMGSTIEPLAVLPKANRVDAQVSIHWINNALSCSSVCLNLDLPCYY